MKLKSLKLKAGTNLKSWYTRGGTTHDKWGNTSHSPLTLRNVHSGLIINQQGKVIGQERNHRHGYGSDAKRAPAGAKAFSSDKQRKAVFAKLRGRR